MQIELDELHRELDEAGDAATRCLRTSERPIRRATLAGYEHAQVERMQRRKSVPRTVVVYLAVRSDPIDLR